MEAFAHRYPNQLSGGQQQRVALARALVNRPAVMLLDEPLGALDLKLRKQMQLELSNLHRSLGITFILVTHDQEEALSLSTRIAVMKAGRIEQVGTPSEIYEHPATAFVADFIGDTNLLCGQLEQCDRKQGRLTTLTGLSIVFRQTEPLSVLQPLGISIRPEKIRLSHQLPAAADNCYQGQVKQTMYLGTHIHCVVQLTTGDCLTVRQMTNQPEPRLAPETPVYASWSAADCRALAT
jgi:spermidine/putrescine transport system ATP-binding protein